MTYDWWLTPVVYAGVSVVLLEARLEKAALRGKKLIYRGSLLFKVLCGGGSLVLTMILYQQWAQTEWWLKLMGSGFIIWFLFGWPKTIVTDQRGIECHWWWRRKIFIPWDQVEYAENGKVNAIEIVGTNARITFEGYNADAARFCKEVTTRSSVKKIVTPSEFTSLHLR